MRTCTLWMERSTPVLRCMSIPCLFGYRLTRGSAKYKSSGKAVMCYFSAGSWEPSRDDALSFPPECYCGAGISYDSKTGKCQGTNANQNKLDGWDEWWLDIHNPTCLSKIQALQTKRIQSFVAKGCDGIDPDNVDAVSLCRPSPPDHCSTPTSKSLVLPRRTRSITSCGCPRLLEPTT